MNEIGMNENKARLLIGAVIPAALALIGLVPYLAAWPDLPDRVASNFTSSGVPRSSMSPANFLVVNGVIFVVGAILCAVGAFARRQRVAVMSMGLAVTGAVLTALSAGVLLVTALTQRGLDDWTEASAPQSIPLLILLVGLGCSAAVAVARLGTFLPSPDVEIGPDARPVLNLEVGEHAVWSRRLRWNSGLLLGVGSFVFALVMGYATGQWSTFVVLLVCAVSILALSTINVRADRSGLQVKYGPLPLPWPKTHIAVDAIESAAVIDVKPKEWGGWGYRGSLKLMNRAAVVLRAGPGIRLDLRNGKAFAVTIDDPTTAVALLNAEIARSELGSVSSTNS